MATFLWVLVVLAATGLFVWWIVKDGIPGAIERRLDCGCEGDGAIYSCTVCGFTQCTEHRYDVHNCNARLAR